MESAPHSECFLMNIKGWHFSGLWPGERPSKYYKYYAFFVVFFLLILYNALLTASLINTPLEIELIIGEVIFYFNLVTVTMKSITIFLRREDILAIFKILDCEVFKGSDEIGRQIVANNIKTFKKLYKMFFIFCQFSFIFFCGSPIPGYLTQNSYVKDLPVSQYHFLSDEMFNNYFVPLYCYQIVGIYVQMMYNVNVDTFLAGLIFFAISQIKLLQHELESLQWAKQYDGENTEGIMEQKLQIQALHKCLRHYDVILQYCSGVQNLINLGMFFQFVMTSAILCVVLCALTLTEDLNILFMMTYLGGMMSQIFLPGWLGTQLTYDSQKLVLAAYSSDWVPRSEPFKRSLKLFMERANTPIVFTGMKFFTLSLETFITITKTAYSFFTLVRNVQDGNV